MRPVCVFANGPGSEIERLRSGLRGPWRPAVRAVMVLLSVQGLPAAQIAGLLECHPATVRRWIGRFNRDGAAGLADRPRSGRPRLGGQRLARRVAALLERPGPWTLPRIWRYLGRPQVSMRTLYRRVRQVAVWRLYIWPHIVNTHLRQVFAKLGVPDRVALAAVVHHSIE
jgi:transposase